MPDAGPSKKPKDTALRQQRLGICQPIISAPVALPVFFLIGGIFLPLGAYIWLESRNIKEAVITYTDCAMELSGLAKLGDGHHWHKCKNVDGVVIDGRPESLLAKGTNITCECEASFQLTESFITASELWTYYALKNFYQNHRRYVRSRDDEQLRGAMKTPDTVNLNCKPFDKKTVGSDDLVVSPCGAIADSLFNDTFTLTFNQKKEGEDNVTPIPIEWTGEGVAWNSDKEIKFKDPENMFEDTAYPEAWPELRERSNVDEDFMVWMRTAAFINFRKFYRRILNGKNPHPEGLLKGDYTLRIGYNYPVAAFQGQKEFIITTSSWIGAKNPAIGTLFILTGAVALLIGIFLTLAYLKCGRNRKLDPIVEKRRKERLDAATPTPVASPAPVRPSPAPAAVPAAAVNTATRSASVSRQSSRQSVSQSPSKLKQDKDKKKKKKK